METDFSDYSQATTSGPDFSSASMGLSDEAMASIGSDENQDQSFFGGPDTPNVMDFGRGSVSNISNAANFDPNFAALNMIGRGLTPSSALRNQISFDVPSQMLPQLEGSRGPLAPKFYSEAERFLQEDLTDFVQSGPGIVGMIGNFLSDNFKDAKNALGKMGNAVGGLDIMGIFSSDTGQKAMDGMADNVAFDASGNRIDLTDTRQIADFPQGDTRPVASIPKVGIETILPSLQQEFFRSGTPGGDIRSGLTYKGPGGSYTFSETMDQRKPRASTFRADPGAVRSPDVYSEGDFDIEDDNMQVADASTFNVLQGLGTKFNPQINEILRQNVSPNLRFESDMRPDVNDPDKLMPYMGLRYNFSV